MSACHVALSGPVSSHVELSYFRPEETDTYITRCQVMSDRGVTLLDLDRPGEVLDFTLTAPDAHYFYLRLLDDSGRKTWSCPVWTGKPFTKKREKKRVPLDKKNMCVYDRVSQKAVPTVICDDPLTPWHSECTTADLIFDLGKETRVSAVSHYPKWLEGALMKQEGLQHYDKVKQFPSAYRISTSLDGENFQFVTCGSFRIFGGEETISFPAVRAKKIRLEILSTVGKAWEREEFADATLAIGEITLWKNA